MSAIHPPLWIISGTREAGKTSFCRRLAEMARSQEIDVAGVLSPAVFESGKKTGIQITDLRSGETRLLAVLRGSEVDGITTERWKFDPLNLAWGNEVLRAATPCDLLLIDELGPLELEQNRGWIEGLSALASKKYKAGVVVIRPELIEKSKNLWPKAKIIEIQPDLNRTLPGELITEMLKACSRG